MTSGLSARPLITCAFAVFASKIAQISSHMYRIENGMLFEKSYPNSHTLGLTEKLFPFGHVTSGLSARPLKACAFAVFASKIAQISSHMYRIENGMLFEKSYPNSHTLGLTEKLFPFGHVTSGLSARPFKACASQEIRWRHHNRK